MALGETRGDENNVTNLDFKTSFHFPTKWRSTAPRDRGDALPVARVMD